MENDKKDKTKSDTKNPNVYTPEPPQVMNPSEQPKKNSRSDKPSKTKKEEKKKTR